MKAWKILLEEFRGAAITFVVAVGLLTFFVLGLYLLAQASS